MDLKFREDRFWLALALSTFPLFYYFPEMGKGSDGDPNAAGYVVFYLAGWFIYSIFTFVAWNEGHPRKENSRHFNPIDRVIWLEEKMYPAKKHEEELSYLKKKYKSELKDIKKTKGKRKREEQDRMQEFQTRSNITLYGSFSPQIVCPHCQTKGKVRKKTKQRVEESREKGVIGATIGRKTITTKGRYTQLHCDKCNVTWEA
jgi:hypothetical protein